MKKVVAIFLACCMLISLFATAANAETKGESLEAAVAAVADKLDPTVIDCLYSAVDDGRYFEISYHGVSEAELIAQIKAISYAETSDYDPGEGKVLVGLPYSSVVKVAALENVDYISLPRGLPYEPPFNGEGGYYIIGTMTDWQLNTNYELTEAYLHNGTYYSWLYMEPNDSFMIVYSPDRKTLDDAVYYPKNGKEFNQNGTIIKEKGFYTFEFRPACDGGITYFENDPAYWFETSGGERVQTWYYNCIFCLGYYRAPAEREPVYDNLTEGYYVVGTMNEWKLDGNYKLNSYNALDDITLRMCDSFKVAYTPDGRNITRWYPDGEGNAYNEDVRRITADSQFNSIEFSPDGSFEDSWETHYGMIKVVSAVPPSEPDPFPIPTEADDDFLGYPIDHWTNNVLIFCNTDGIFTSATVRYIEDGSAGWKSAQMTYGGKDEYNERFWYFTMPSKKCRYYITDGTHRTQEDYFTHETLLFLMNETDENGYYNLCLDSYANEPSYLYRDKLKERYNLGEFDGGWDTYQLMGYQELYYHRDNNGELDWALIQCYCNIEMPVEMTAVVGNRVLHPGREYYPFSTTYGIYDVKNDKFVGANSKAAYGYDDFIRVFDEIAGSGMGWSLADYDNNGKGKPLGDIDKSGELDIVDVTMIQRCNAEMMAYPADDEFYVTYDYNGTHYYSDFNCDGERDILDATCIQRYLAYIPYPVG